jgi:hypothetical protein
MDSEILAAEERTRLNAEWLLHFRDAIRFGADNVHAGKIADVLTYGSVLEVQ